jgi:hypothetical protein
LPPSAVRWSRLSPQISTRVSAGWLRLLLVAALLILVLPSPEVFSQVGPGASLTVVRGSVSVTRPDGTAIYPAGTGLTLAIGDVVGTLERTRAIVTFFSGSEIELGSNTTIVIRRLDRDLLDSANVTVEHLSGMTVIRVNSGQPVRVLAGDTIALIRSGEAGHGVDPNTNNITVVCVDGGNKCTPNGVAFPTVLASLPGALVRIQTGRGDRLEIRARAGDSVWDLLAEGGALGQSEGTEGARGKPGTGANSRAGDDDDDKQPKPNQPTATATPTTGPPTLTPVLPTPTPPAGAVGPPCGSLTLPGGGGVTTTAHNVNRTSGTLRIDWNAFGAADRFQIFYENVEIFNSGFVTNLGGANVPFGPGTSTFVQVVVTGGPGSTQWEYTLSCLP